MSKHVRAFIKTAAALAALSILGAPAAYAEDIQKFLCDGNIQLTGTTDEAEQGGTIGVLVTEEAFDWFDEAAWKGESYDLITYADSVTVGENGEYAFNIFLDEMGIYNVVVGSQSYKILFTDAAANADMIERVNSAETASDLYEILKTEEAVQALILDDEIFTGIYNEQGDALLKLAEIIYEENKTNKITDPYEYIAMVYKACAAVMMNGDSSVGVSDMNDYKDYLLLDKTGLDKYYNESYSEYATELIKEERIKSVSDFDDRLLEALLLANIRYNDSISNLISMLKEYADELDIRADKVTDSLVRQMVGKTYTLEEARDYINNSSSSSTGSGGSGGSGGGGSTGGGSTGGGTTSRPSTGGGSVPGHITTSDPIHGDVITNDQITYFDDLESVPWAEQAINKLALKGIISGRSESAFCPNENITREEYVKLLVSVFSLNVVGDDMSFEDVDESAWYYQYVNCAYNAGIVTGISESSFGIGQPITRQDMAVMTARASYIAGLELEEQNEENEYTDEADIADYAVEDVHTLQKAGLMVGNDSGAFSPKANATRAEASMVISSIYDLL